MKNENPLDKLFNQIGDLMSVIYQKRSQPIENLPPDIQEKLKKLEEDVQLFCHVNDIIIKNAGATPEEIQNTLTKQKIDTLPQKDQTLLKKADKLKNELEMEHIQMKIIKEKMKETQGLTEEGKNKSIRKKQRKKPLTGNKNWIPL